MASQYRNRSRNLRSSAWTMLKSAGRAAGSGSSSLARWAMTDHYGFSRRLPNMPVMGWLDTLLYSLMLFLAQIVYVLVSAVLTGLFFAFGIPFLLTILWGD